MIYRLFFKLVLQHMDPEHAHALAQRALRVIRGTAVGRWVLRSSIGGIDPCLEVKALGLTFPTPLGVAAGLDKEAGWFDDLAALGFGFVEVGTVTALPQEGNPPPRITRLVADRALINRMGFPNPGAEAVAARLAGRRTNTIVGVNIGKSRVVAVEEASGDYQAAARRLAPVADYLVLNVSSPNTPGLRALQAADRLRPLIMGVRRELGAIDRAVPLLLKLDPDLEDEQIRSVAELALELNVDGMVIVNTTLDRFLLSAQDLPGEGGISGAPLRARALEVLRLVRQTTGEKLVLVSVGGIESAEDVWNRILAGATLVQAYTAFVYQGPGWPRRVNRELARRVRQVGASSIQELVGASEGGAAAITAP